MSFKDAVNQSVVTRVIKEVRSVNASFQASHIRSKFILTWGLIFVLNCMSFLAEILDWDMIILHLKINIMHMLH